MYLLYVKIWNSSKFQFPCILFARDIHVHPGFISRDSYRGFYAFIFYTVNVYMSRIHSYIAYIYNIIPYRAYAKRGTPSFHLSFFHYYYYIFFITIFYSSFVVDCNASTRDMVACVRILYTSGVYISWSNPRHSPTCVYREKKHFSRVLLLSASRTQPPTRTLYMNAYIYFFFSRIFCIIFLSCIIFSFFNVTPSV